ncbi:hypothetical protein [Microvirga sesbaniae]|uniref:hypothetical protein n=1 Tax=Microvirga sesbaniae TaxID=681392 RepID=UPI0021C6888A|nr:hypothetical protein [Microvirga sp. HBU67692]
MTAELPLREECMLALHMLQNKPTIGGAGLRTFFGIAKAWGPSTDEQVAILINPAAPSNREQDLNDRGLRGRLSESLGIADVQIIAFLVLKRHIAEGD